MMIKKTNSDQDLLLNNNDSLIKRLTLFSFVILVCWASGEYLMPLFMDKTQGLKSLIGNGPIIQNVLAQILPLTIVCSALYFLFRKANIIPKALFKGNFNTILKEGVLWAFITCVVTIALALQVGYKIGFNFNLQSILGNIVSNSYEEFTFRVFLLSISAYAFRNVWSGIFITSILFALMHAQYPLPMQILVGMVSLFFTLAYVRSKSFFAALLAHQLADMILDTILVR